MATNVARYHDGRRPAWGVVDGSFLRPIEGEFATTAAFMSAASRAVAHGDADLGEARDLDKLRILCPITENQQVICQAINYRSHMAESGTSPESSPFNIFFRKASSCLAPADTDIVRPSHVEFLDYELEIGLVFSDHVTEPIEVEPADLSSHVGALVMLNDVSARDVQIPETQFYKGKSYRTFGPAGPWLTLVDAGELKRFSELHLRLSVNGEARQDAFASDMVHQPAPTLTELSGVQNWSPGDILATGTPGGCALQAPPKPLAALAQILSPKRRAELLRRAATRNPKRLDTGDQITATIRTDDGAIDLGEQRCSVVDVEPTNTQSVSPTRS
jgi:2-keto-4-pentenoate hydratase/2-oxohepta-3-ene-1,7-dioic acid hydratase in catechol pathway